MLCFLLLAACAGTPAAVAWEYRVLEFDEFMGGKILDEKVFQMLEDGSYFERLNAARRKWAREGWDYDPANDNTKSTRVFLRRNRHDPEPFELYLLLQTDLQKQSAAEVQGQINRLMSEGWNLTSNNAIWIEFQRPL